LHLSHEPSLTFSPKIETFLESVHCDSALFPLKGTSLVTLTRNTFVTDAFKILAEARISSAPVVDDEGRAIYVLGVGDLVNFILHHFTEEDMKSNHDIEDLIQKKGQLAHVKVKHMSEDIEQKYSAFNTENLSVAVKTMILKRAHRILVITQDSIPEALISQSRIVQMLHILADEHKLRKTVEDIQLGFKEVHSIPTNASAFQAFKLMKEKKVSAVAVVDLNGRLVGTISIADIKALGDRLTLFQLLGESTESYMNHIQKSREADDIRPMLLSCRKTSTLDYVETDHVLEGA
jgi:CBS domain-containing protein